MKMQRILEQLETLNATHARLKKNRDTKRKMKGAEMSVMLTQAEANDELYSGGLKCYVDGNVLEHIIDVALPQLTWPPTGDFFTITIRWESLYKSCFDLFDGKWHELKIFRQTKTDGQIASLLEIETIARLTKLSLGKINAAGIMLVSGDFTLNQLRIAIDSQEIFAFDNISDKPCCRVNCVDYMAMIYSNMKDSGLLDSGILNSFNVKRS